MKLTFYAVIVGTPPAITPEIMGNTTTELHHSAWSKCVGSDHVLWIAAVIDGDTKRPIEVYNEQKGWLISDPITADQVIALR